MVRLVTSVAVASAVILTYSAPVKRDYSTVLSDLNNISSQTSTLNANLKALSDTAPDLQSALNINTAAGTLDTAVKAAVTDAQAALAAGFPGTSDSRAILSSATEFIPVILDTLTLIVTKKATFAKLPIAVAPLIIVDLTDLFTDAQPFEDALISIVPDRLKSIGNQLTSSIDAAFSTALVAYGGTPAAPTHASIKTQGPPATTARPPASVASVIADVNAIGNGVGTLDSDLTAFGSASSLSAALAIDNDAQDLLAALSAATTDVNSAVSQGPVSVADATTIINSISGFAPKIIDALTQIVAQKSAFASLSGINVTPLVLSDLADIYTDTTAFEAALISAAPDAVRASGISIANKLNTALSTALAAYGSTVKLPTYSGGGSPPTTTPAPPTTTPVPPTTTPVPPTTTPKPPTTTPVPPTTTPAPPTTTPKPPTTTPVPPTTTPKPPTTTPKPPTTTPKPPTTTPKPPTTTPKPPTTTPKPPTTTPKPPTTTPKPPTTTPKPPTTTLKPTTTKPVTTKPATTTHKPTGPTHKPPPPPTIPKALQKCLKQKSPILKILCFLKYFESLFTGHH